MRKEIVTMRPTAKMTWGVTIIVWAVLSTGVSAVKRLYEWDPKAKDFIEFMAPYSKDRLFESSNAKVVELYNPYCVRFAVFC